VAKIANFPQEVIEGIFHLILPHEVYTRISMTPSRRNVCVGGGGPR
jgi:hypothetical protein